MGRLPVIQNDAGNNIGRDHNTYGFSMWLAGGGFKRADVHGETDEFGHHAVRCRAITTTTTPRSSTANRGKSSMSSARKLRLRVLPFCHFALIESENENNGTCVYRHLFFLGQLSAAPPERPTQPAPPKKGVRVNPPLSANPPRAYLDLDLFASIQWKTQKLPWVDEGPYAGISGTAMVVHAGKIYVVGGFIPGGDETDDSASRRTSRWCWVYDPQNDRWSRLPDAPIRREYTRGTVAGDALFLFGGGNQYKGQNPAYRVHGDCAMLDLSQSPPAWSLHSKLQVPRTHTSVGHLADLLVVAGGNEYDFAEKGYSRNTIRNTTEIFDLSNPQRGWQQSAPLPGTGRGWSASIIAKKRLYLFGGLTWNEAGEIKGIRETLVFDADQQRWQQKTPAPLAVSGWEAASYADRFALLAGGVVRPENKRDNSIIWSDLIWGYDTQTDRWLRVNGKLPPGGVFNDPGVAVIGETIYVLGGEGPHGSHYNYFLIGHIQRELP